MSTLNALTAAGPFLRAARNQSTSTDIDLSGAWDKFWGAITAASGADQIINLLGIIGVALVAMALIKWAWDRRRGGGGGMGQQSSAVWGALLIGAILSAPGVILPILLTFMDVIANAGISIWNNTTA
ncbi:hypothetical protein [Nocardioides pakistanensis]